VTQIHLMEQENEQLVELLVLPSSGGGVSGTNPGLLTSSGGLFGSASALLIPIYDPETNLKYIATLDPTDFNSEEDAEYRYRMEEVTEGRLITVSRVRIVHRNIGKVTVTGRLSGLIKQADKTWKVVFAEQTITIGDDTKDLSIRTEYFDMIITMERPQFIYKRLANAGPLAIISTTLITNVEQAAQI
jgi:hypothetical protein